MTRVNAFRSSRGPVLVAMMTTNALVAVNATLLATSAGTIVGEFGGLELFPWLFSLYLLGQAVSIPVYAKLADRIGRKRVILFGLALFAVGSILCGAAWDMTSLITLRAIQGLGAGAVHPIAVTIVGDLYPVRERASVQGYLASAWGAGSVAGPILGGLLASAGAWRFGFLVNVVFCVAVGVLIARYYREAVVGRGGRLDVAGATVFAAALGLLVLGLLDGGVVWEWWSVPGVVCLGGGVLLLVAFGFIEVRAADPIVPPWILRHRVVVSAVLISVAAGAIVAGLSTYVPLYLTGSLGLVPLVASLSLAAFMVGWPIAAAVSAQIYPRSGFGMLVLAGSLLMVVGSVVLALAARTPSLPIVLVACLVIGLGLGLGASPSLIAAQASVEWGDRGVVSGLVMLGRLVGSALGIAVFGALANLALHAAVADPGPEGFHDVGAAVFWGLVGSAVLALAASWVMPRRRPDTEHAITERSI